MTIAKDLVGSRFRRLLVIELAEITKNRQRFWKCKCDCGNITSVKNTCLTSGQTTSCGCYAREVSAKLQAERTIHGHARRGETSREYRSWRSMLDRCENKNYPSYLRYGALGIKVCEQWHNFENFLSDMGPRPDRMTLDRFPNKNGDYEPENCRWATTAQQARNTRRNIIVEFNGLEMCLKDACLLAGVNYSTAQKRIKNGHHWSTPV